MSMTETLRLVIAGDSKGAVRAVDALDKKTTNTLKKAETQAKKAFGAWGESMNKAANVAAGGFAVGLGIITKSVYDFQKRGSEIRSIMRSTGMDAAGASLLEAQWKRYGVEAGAAGMATKTLAKAITEARQGNEQYAKSFATLGLSAAELAAMSDSEAIFATRDALAELGPGLERTSTATKLLGRGALSMSSWFSQSAESMAETNKLIEESGLVWDEKTVEQYAAAAKAQAELKIAMRGISEVVARDVVPAMTPFVELLGDGLRLLKPLAPAIVPVTMALGGFVSVVKIANMLSGAWGQTFGRLLPQVHAHRTAVESETRAVTTQTTAVEANTRAWQKNNTTVSRGPGMRVSGAAGAGVTGLGTTVPGVVGTGNSGMGSAPRPTTASNFMGGMSVGSAALSIGSAAVTTTYAVIEATYAFGEWWDAEKQNKAAAEARAQTLGKAIGEWQAKNPGQEIPPWLQQALDDFNADFKLGLSDLQKGPLGIYFKSERNQAAAAALNTAIKTYASGNEKTIAAYREGLQKTDQAAAASEKDALASDQNTVAVEGLTGAVKESTEAQFKTMADFLRASIEAAVMGKPLTAQQAADAARAEAASNLADAIAGGYTPKLGYNADNAPLDKAARDRITAELEKAARKPKKKFAAGGIGVARSEIEAVIGEAGPEPYVIGKRQVKALLGAGGGISFDFSGAQFGPGLTQRDVERVMNDTLVPRVLDALAVS